MENTQEQETAQLIADILRDSGREIITPQKEEVKTVEEIVKNDTPLPEPPKEKEEFKEEIKFVEVTNYSKKLKALIEDDIIENFEINYNVDGEDKIVFINDIDDLTDEGYKQILAGIKTAKKAEIDSKYIEKGNLDDSFLKIIETRKAGGDITEQLRVNVTAIDQLTQLKENIDNEQVQINIVAHSLEQQGIKKGVIKAQIDAHIEDGTLEEEANSILDIHFGTHRQAIEDKRQGELERIEKEKEDNKNFKKDLTSNFKEMKLPEPLIKVLVDNATKLDQDRISNTDKLYFNTAQDAETIFFLNDREGYKKYINSSILLKTKIQESKNMITVNINKTSKPTLSKDSESEWVEQVRRANN